MIRSAGFDCGVFVVRRTPGPAPPVTLVVIAYLRSRLVRSLDREDDRGDQPKRCQPDTPPDALRRLPYRRDPW